MDFDDALDFLTTADDATQRLKENPPDPLQSIREEHEEFLSELERLAVEAIAFDDWNNFYAHLIDFQSRTGLHGVTGIAIGEDDASTSRALGNSSEP